MSSSVVQHVRLNYLLTYLHCLSHRHHLACFVVAVVANDDDMVEFLKSLGLKGAVGFLELSITGVPLLHVVASGIRHSFVHCCFTIVCY